MLKQILILALFLAGTEAVSLEKKNASKSISDSELVNLESRDDLAKELGMPSLANFDLNEWF